MIDRKKFFDYARRYLFGGTLTQSQVEGCEAIIREYEARNLVDIRWLAYILATAYHETGLFINGKLVHTMQPVEEMGKGKGKKYGKPDPETGLIYYGRGHTQNTWSDNYKRLTAAAKAKSKPWDFYQHPELLLQMEPSIWASYQGMITGLYTGKKLQHYFSGIKNEPVEARRIINGKDRAQLVAGYHNKFLSALT